MLDYSKTFELKKQNRMSVAECATLMCASEQYIRTGLQNKELPFGFAVKGKGDRFTYWISVPKFQEYTGITQRW